MKLKTALTFGLPLLTAGALVGATPAQAAVLFSVGDELSFAGSVDFSQGILQAPAGGSEFRFEDINGNPVNRGGFGNFGVLPTSTGAFAPYINNGALDSDYQIRSFDIANVSQGGDVVPTGTPAPTLPANLLNNPALNPSLDTLALPGDFITLEGGFSTNNPDIRIVLEGIENFATTPIGANQFQTVVSSRARFFADNVGIGVGSFNATFVQGDTDTSYSATFVVQQIPPIVKEVPEPASLLGLVTVGALATTGLVKRKQSSQKV